MHLLESKLTQLQHVYSEVTCIRLWCLCCLCFKWEKPQMFCPFFERKIFQSPASFWLPVPFPFPQHLFWDVATRTVYRIPKMAKPSSIRPLWYWQLYIHSFSKWFSKMEFVCPYTGSKPSLICPPHLKFSFLLSHKHLWPHQCASSDFFKVTLTHICHFAFARSLLEDIPLDLFTITFGFHHPE